MGRSNIQSGQDIPDEKTREDTPLLEGWEFVRFTGGMCCIRAVRSRNYVQLPTVQRYLLTSREAGF